MPDSERPRLILDHVLRFGQLQRGDVPAIAGVRERAARNDVAGLVAAGFLKSSGHKAPLRIGLPLDHRERLFPSLFVDPAPPVAEPPVIPDV